MWGRHTYSALLMMIKWVRCNHPGETTWKSKPTAVVKYNPYNLQFPCQPFPADGSWVVINVWIRTLLCTIDFVNWRWLRKFNPGSLEKCDVELCFTGVLPCQLHGGVERIQRKHKNSQFYKTTTALMHIPTNKSVLRYHKWLTFDVSGLNPAEIIYPNTIVIP